jgi:hypothetical protein
MIKFIIVQVRSISDKDHNHMDHNTNFYTVVIHIDHIHCNPILQSIQGYFFQYNQHISKDVHEI